MQCYEPHDIMTKTIFFLTLKSEGNSQNELKEDILEKFWCLVQCISFVIQYVYDKDCRIPTF